MADKQDRWLDRETAERLLRGESPDNAVDGAAREEAERLARTLGALSALSAGPVPDDEELPGEAAALAAFRKAHAHRTDLAARTDLARPDPARTGGADTADDAAHVVDAGLVRIGGRGAEPGRRPRRSRTVRLGLAAALAVGMAGGVAAAAGTGLLPTPFDDTRPGRPVASVSAPASSGRPLVSPSPHAPATPSGATPSATPDRHGDGDGGRGTGDDPAAAPGAAWPRAVTSSCREVSAGRTLDAQRRRALEERAGGPKRVPGYCAAVLDGASAGSSRGDGHGAGKGAGGRDGGKGDGKGKGNRGGQGGAGGRDGSGDGAGRGDDADDDHDGGRGHGRGGAVSGGGGARAGHHGGHHGGHRHNRH